MVVESASGTGAVNSYRDNLEFGRVKRESIEI